MSGDVTEKEKKEERERKEERGTEERFQGLCVDCKHRYVCILSKLPGGVWHCEEYE